MLTKLTILSVIQGAVLTWLSTSNNTLWLFFTMAGLLVSLLKEKQDKKRVLNFYFYLYSITVSTATSVLCYIGFADGSISRFWLFAITLSSSIFAPNLADLMQSEAPAFVWGKIKIILTNISEEVKLTDIVKFFKKDKDGK